MSETKDLKELLTRATDYATRNIDLYTLVGLEGDPSAHNDPKAIHRSWRKTSAKHHPDKTGDAFDKDKWELLEHARDILLEPAARAAYDNGRAAQLRRAAEREKVQGERKRFIDQLEADELEAKRRRDEKAEKAREVELEMARMREEGARRLAEEDERFRRENLERQAENRTREDEEYDEKVADLQGRLDELRRRKAEKKAAKKRKRDGPGAVPEEPEPVPAPTATERNGDGAAKRPPEKADQPPKWEDLKARMIAVQRKRDAAKLAAQQAQGETPARPAEQGTEA